jgi:hypothetical protein
MARSQTERPESYCFSIEEFLGRHNPLVIPQWQRGYAWQEQHVEDFLEDLLFFYQENVDKDPKKQTFYMLGQVITVETDREEFEVVDGQQRLTTLYLLLIVLYRTLVLFPTNGERLNYVRGTIQLRISTQISDKSILNLKSLYQDGTKVLEYLWKQGLNDFEQVGKLSISQERIKDNYGVIEDWVSKNLTTEIELVNFSNLLLYNVMLSRLKISSIKSAIDTFEKMNNRGVDLQDSDLLKNYLFQNISDDQYDKLTQNWTKLSSHIADVPKTQKSLRSEGTFIKYLGISESGKKINNTKQLFEEFEERYPSPQQLLEYSNQLPEISKFYKEICNFESIGSESQFDHSKLHGSKYLKAVQTLPALLAARKLKNYNTAAQLIDSRFSIYILGRERTQDFETLIPRIVQTINDNLGPDSSKDEIVEKINHTMGFVNFDMAEQLRNGIKSLTYQKSSNRTKMRFILAKVNKKFDLDARFGDCDKPLDEYLKTRNRRSTSLDGIDLDHVLAQQYLNDFNEIDQKIMNEIGAVTFVHASEHQDGPRISDAYPIDKSSLYSQSRYVLTKALSPIHDVTPRVQTVIDEIQTKIPSKLNEWNIEVVRNRTDFIIETFLDILIDENVKIPNLN